MTRRRSISESTPMGQIARFYPATIELFESMDIEYGCKGARPLRDAAVAAGYAADEVLHAIDELTHGVPPAEETTITELVQTIITTHHRSAEQRFRDVLVTLQNAEESVDARRLRQLLLSSKAALSQHMVREERDLFPRIEELEQHPHRVRVGSLSRPLLMEFVEHDTIHEWLVKVRELGLRLRIRGADAALLERIDDLDRSVHRHLHSENNVLIPRVVDLEHRLRSRRLASAAQHPTSA